MLNSKEVVYYSSSPKNIMPRQYQKYVLHSVLTQIFYNNNGGGEKKQV